MWKEQGSGGGGGQGPRGEAGASLESKNRVNARETLHTGKEQRQEGGASAPWLQTRLGGLGKGLGARQCQARGPGASPAGLRCAWGWPEGSASSLQMSPEAPEASLQA